MKVKFFYESYHSPANELRGEIFNMALYGQLFGAPEEITVGYQSYLLSALRSDYGKDKECCDDVLNIIERLEKGEIDYYEGGGMGFMHLMTPESETEYLSTVQMDMKLAVGIIALAMWKVVKLLPITCTTLG